MPRKKIQKNEKLQVEKTDAFNVDEVESLKEAFLKERKNSQEYLDKLKYLQADFENYKKRVNREIGDAITFGNQKLITELLTVLDELEYAINAGKNSNNKDALLHGVEITLKKLYGLLEKEGLSKIETVGKEFNPFTHEVVQRVSGDGDEELIVEEVRAGFTLKGKVLRPSLVKIAYQPSTDSNFSKKKVKKNE
jgi:molecular chaperone GrpE